MAMTMCAMVCVCVHCATAVRSHRHQPEHTRVSCLHGLGRCRAHVVFVLTFSSSQVHVLLSPPLPRWPARTPAQASSNWATCTAFTSCIEAKWGGGECSVNHSHKDLAGWRKASSSEWPVNADCVSSSFLRSVCHWYATFFKCSYSGRNHNSALSKLIFFLPFHWSPELNKLNPNLTNSTRRAVIYAYYNISLYFWFGFF